MTLSTTVTSNLYNADGTTYIFPYSFKILDTLDLKVYVDDTGSGRVLRVADGAGTYDYTVTGVGNDTGGSVVFNNPPPARPSAVLLQRTLPLVQESQYVNGSGNDLEIIEADFDHAIMLIQQLNEAVERTVRVSIGDSISEIPDSITRSNTLIGFDADGALILRGDVNLGSVSVSGYMTTLLGASSASQLRGYIGGTSDIFVNVQDYGAKGDGVTDDTAAVLAALASVSGNATIFFPSGNYIVGQISTGIKSGITLRGEGYRSTTLTCKTGTNTHLVVFGNGSTYVSGCSIEDLRLLGNSAGNSAGSCVRFWSTEDNRIARCEIRDAKEQGVLFEGNGTRNATYLRISDSYLANNKGHGVYALNQAYGLHIIHNTIAGNGLSPAGGAGIAAVSNDGHQIIGNLIDENSHGILLYSVSDATIANNFVQNGNRHGILLDGASIYNNIVNNYILNPSTETANTYGGIIISNSAQNNVCNNFIWANTVTASDGVKEIGTSNNNVIKENRLYGTITNPVIKTGAGSVIKGNTGYKTESEGTSTIASGGTISHGLAATPTVVQVTSRVAGHFASVTARSSSTITVAIYDVNTGLPVVGSEAVDWRASF